MAISIKSAAVQKNTDGTYSVNIFHTDGKTSVVNFTHVPFAAELATAYADSINGVVKAVNALSPVASTVEADAKKLVAEAEAEAVKVRAEADGYAAAVKTKVEALYAEAKVEAAKLVADAKAEVAKLTAGAGPTSA